STTPAHGSLLPHRSGPHPRPGSLGSSPPGEGGDSSVGQSNGLIIRRSRVQAPVAPPRTCQCGGVHDLTHPITSGMQTYRGAPSVTCTPALRIATDGVSVGHWGLGSHTGTHVDAPAHVIEGGRTLAEVALHELCGEAIVLRVEVGEGSPYGLAELEAAVRLPARLSPIVVIDTGWASYFGTERALLHPYLDGSAAAELLRRGMH